MPCSMPMLDYYWRASQKQFNMNTKFFSTLPEL